MKILREVRTHKAIRSAIAGGTLFFLFSSKLRKAPKISVSTYSGKNEGLLLRSVSITNICAPLNSLYALCASSRVS